MNFVTTATLQCCCSYKVHTFFFSKLETHWLLIHFDVFPMNLWKRFAMSSYKKKICACNLFIYFSLWLVHAKLCRKIARRWSLYRSTMKRKCLSHSLICDGMKRMHANYTHDPTYTDDWRDSHCSWHTRSLKRVIATSVRCRRRRRRCSRYIR